MDYQFKRLLDLVRRTGDRLVVTDLNGEDTYVLMGLSAYEKLLDTEYDSPLTTPPFFPREEGLGERADDYCDEDEDNEEDFGFKPDWDIPDELNPDDVEARNPVPQKLDTPISKDIWNVMPPAGSESRTWNQEEFGEEEKKIAAEKFENPEFSQKPAEKEDNEPGEEQFYLEPIE